MVFFLSQIISLTALLRYCVTAGHVIYGNKYELNRIVDILDIRGERIKRFEQLTFLDFAKKIMTLHYLDCTLKLKTYSQLLFVVQSPIANSYLFHT